MSLSVKNLNLDGSAKPYRGIPLIIMLTGFALSLLSAWLLYKISDAASERQWRQIAQDEITHVERHVERSLGWLEATHGLYQASNHVSLAEFNAFVSALGIDDRLIALEWAPYLTHEKRAAFVKEIRNEHKTPNFQIVERTEAGGFQPRKDADWYIPVTYIFPIQNNLPAHGFDLASDPIRLETIQTAVRYRTVTATSRVNLIQGVEEQYGFLVKFPFYRKVESIEKGGQAIDVLKGFLVGVFLVENLIARYIDDKRAAEYSFDLFDLSAPKGMKRLYPKGADESVRANAFLHEFRDIKVADRTWRVFVSGNTSPFSLSRLLPPISALVVGLVLTSFLVFQLLIARRKSAESFAVHRHNQELLAARQEAEAQQVLVEARESELKTANNEISKKVNELEMLSGQLSRYLSPQLFDQLFTGQQNGATMSARKKMTVLFSDLVDFANFSDQIAPEELTMLVNEYMTEMSKIVDRYGGTIDKFLGDGILIFFGDHNSRGAKEDAIACTKMALEMRSRLAELNMNWQASGIILPVVCRIGISTGYCTVGNFGSDERLDYTILGSTVNLASRLESIAKPNAILISQVTHMQIRSHFECKSLGKKEIRGFKSMVGVWQVTKELTEDNQLTRKQRTKLPHLELDLSVDEMSLEELDSADSAIEKARQIIKLARKKPNNPTQK